YKEIGKLTINDKNIGMDKYLIINLLNLGNLLKIKNQTDPTRE
ncbi:hypothetical protein YPPY59_3350, partial [Yersinia pestis PY-59]